MINKIESKNSNIKSSISGMLFFKLILISLLLAAATTVNILSSSPELLRTSMQRAILGIIIFEYFSVLVLLWIMQHKPDKLKTGFILQLFADIIATSGLIHFTGGVQSPYFVLYLYSIVSSAIIYSPEFSAFFTAVTLILYTIVAVSGWADFLPVLEGQILIGSDVKLDDLIRTIFLNSSASAFVSALSMFLAKKLQSAEAEAKLKSKKISELKIRHKDILDSLKEAVLTVDSEGKIIDSNQALVEILDLNEDILNINELNPDFTKLMNKPPLVPLKTSITVKNTTIPVEVSVEKLKSQTTEASVFVIRDLREIEKLRKKINQNEKLAVLGRMATGIAHEIRNPLGSISGSLELLTSSFTSETDEDKELLDIIFGEIDRLNNMINELLDYTREKKYLKIRTDLVKLTKEVIILLKSNPVFKDCDLKLESPDKAECTADPEALKQVMLNIIINASEASSDKKINICISKNDEKITFSVSDKGLIIPNEKINKIFEPFYSGKTSGNGLGLSIASKIITDHGGNIYVETSTEEKTVITFEIPVS